MTKNRTTWQWIWLAFAGVFGYATFLVFLTAERMSRVGWNGWEGALGLPVFFLTRFTVPVVAVCLCGLLIAWAKYASASRAE